MNASFLNWLGIGRSNKTVSRPLLRAASWPALVYAIGDIHGCLDELRALENKIVEDSKGIDGDKWLVYLGDYIDRGPNSAGVIDHLLAPAPAGFTRTFLAGNHEVMMLDYLAELPKDDIWLGNGGLDTLRSYGLDTDRFQQASRRGRDDMINSTLPSEHRDFLALCALGLSLPGVTFVHAGLKPGIPLKQQKERDLLWIRDEFLQATWPADQLIVHGHTPAEEPQLAIGRLGIDTGAFATGRLTAVRLAEGKLPHFIFVSSR